MTKNVLYLKKDPQNLFYIAEETQQISNNSFTQGTRISLRKIITASKTAPIEVKANLLSFVDGFPNLKITFNNEELKKSSKIGLSGEPLLTALLPKDNSKIIEFYAHPQGGLFYNKLAHAMNINNYIDLLPLEIKKLFNSVPYQLAINLKGDFKQNANRTGFIELENYQDFIKENFLKAVFLLIAKEVQDKPDILAGYLPYDFYYEFRFSDHLLNNINNIGNLKKDDIGKYLLGIKLPCGYSLIELKNNVSEILKNNNIINSNGKYNKDADLPDNLLNSICSDKLATKFESEIRNQFLLMDSQASISKDDVDPNLSENDFELENLPLDFESKKTNLKIFKDFFENIAKNHLNLDLDIWFYHAADASGAHAKQGQYSALKKIIAFNLIGGYYNAFENMLIKKEWDDKVYFDVIETMTHEITHAHEPSMSSTHDRSFYESQEKWLQKFFDKSISQKGFLRIFKRLYIDN